MMEIAQNRTKEKYSPEQKLWHNILFQALKDALKNRHKARQWFIDLNPKLIECCEILDLDSDRVRLNAIAFWTKLDNDLDFKRKPIDKARRLIIKDMLEKGLSTNRIESSLGVEINIINEVANQYNLTVILDTKYWTQDFKDAVRLYSYKREI